MTIKEAAEWWNRKYPQAVVTEQTLRNWAKKYNFGKKKNFLPRSKWIVDKDAFMSFLTNIENTCKK